MQTARAGTPQAAKRSSSSFPSLLSAKQTSMEELVEMCKEGKQGAMEAFIRRIRPTVCRRALFHAKNSSEADDLTAESMLRIYRRIDTIKDVGSLNAWIDRIVRNVWIDIWRSDVPHRFVSLDALDEWDLDRYICRPLFSESPSLDKNVERDESSRIVNKAIGTLPASLYQTVVMFYCEDRQYDEISNEMGIPIGTVKSRLNRARAVLRDKLAPYTAILMM